MDRARLRAAIRMRGPMRWSGRRHDTSPCQRLRKWPFPSRRLDTVAIELALALQGLVPHAPRIPIISTLTGARSPEMNAAYWGRQCRAPVRFHDAICALPENGVSVFLEVGAHPALAGVMQVTVEDGILITITGTLTFDVTVTKKQALAYLKAIQRLEHG